MISSNVLITLTEYLFARGLDVRFRVSGSSMRPFLEGGDVVTVRAICAEEICLGDIVLVKTGEGCAYLHRIVATRHSVSEKMYITRGDAHVLSDGPVFSRNILGRIVSVHRTAEGRTSFSDLTSIVQRHFAVARVIVYSIRSMIVKIDRSFSQLLEDWTGRVMYQTDSRLIKSRVEKD